jgi:hypothetical protein
MPLRTPELYTQLGVALLQPQQWQMYYEPDPFAFIVQNLVAALMLRKGMRQQSLRDMMEWMTRMGPEQAMQWLKFQPFRDLFKKQTGLKEKDLQQMETTVEEMLVSGLEGMVERILSPEQELMITPPSPTPMPAPIPAPSPEYPPHLPMPMPVVPVPTSGFVPPKGSEWMPFMRLVFPGVQFPWVLY